MTSSMFYTEPLHVILTSSTSKGFVGRYGFMKKIYKLEIWTAFSFTVENGSSSFLPIVSIYLTNYIVTIPWRPWSKLFQSEELPDLG